MILYTLINEVPKHTPGLPIPVSEMVLVGGLGVVSIIATDAIFALMKFINDNKGREHSLHKNRKGKKGTRKSTHGSTH